MPRPLGPPPDERPNWERLNEGQRRYAWEQYNLAKVRRGISIDHPIPDPADNQPSEPVQEEPAEAPEEHSPVLDNNQEEEEEPFDLDEILDRPVDPDLLEATINELGLRDMSTGSQPMEIEQVSSTGNAPKRTSTSSSSSTKRTRTGSSLPGTAGGIGGGGMEQAMEPIPRPMYSAHKQVRHFRKVHRLLTFGLAYKPVAVPRAGPPAYNDVYMVTSLAHIPWEYPFMYLNPSEFALLPPGSRCTKVRCQVKSENVRIAFSTNSSETNLATLNQNKFLRCGVGLNQKIQSVNAQPGGFSTPGQPMIATSVTDFSESTLDLWSQNFYGVPNDRTTAPNQFLTQTPRHQFGIPWVAQHYFMPVSQDNDPTKSGWEDLQAVLEEVKVDGPSGTILDETYHPHMGLLKQPINAIWTGVPSTGTPGTAKTVPVNTGAGNTQHRRINTTIQNGTVSGNVEEATNWSTPHATNFTTTKMIEKNQRICSGITPEYFAGTQPSLHVGVMPVPALTTSAIDNVTNNSSFTDAQAYFEIICEMEVECAFPTRRPLANVANTTMGNIVYQKTGNGEQSYSSSMAYGLFQTS